MLYEIAGRLRKDAFFPPNRIPLEGISQLLDLNRNDLHTTRVRVDPHSAMSRKKERQENDSMWRKGKRKESEGHENTTDIFKRKRVS